MLIGGRLKGTESLPGLILSKDKKFWDSIIFCFIQFYLKFLFLFDILKVLFDYIGTNLIP